MSALSREVEQRLDQLQVPFNAAGVDPYGVSKKYLRTAATALGHCYRTYFSVRCGGIENVPTQGRAMLVCNHSGGYAVDASMLAAACFFEMQPPRLVHGMADKFIARLPYMSTWAARVGQLTGLPQHARRLLADERLLMVFPEGTAGTAKLYKQRHELVRFGTGFVRLALEMKCPIIPVAVLGAADAVPTVANVYWLGKLFGVPYVPITPYVVPFPLPARLTIRFGLPLSFEGNGQEDDRTILDLVDRVKAEILALLELGKIDERRR